MCTHLSVQVDRRCRREVPVKNARIELPDMRWFADRRVVRPQTIGCSFFQGRIGVARPTLDVDSYARNRMKIGLSSVPSGPLASHLLVRQYVRVPKIFT